jgi:hypothetical protein
MERIKIYSLLLSLRVEFGAKVNKKYKTHPLSEEKMKVW